MNPKCPAKFIKKFAHFVSRDAFNVDGLSEETLMKFIDKGYIKEYADIFKLNRFEEDIVNMPGFGRKSYEKIILAVDNARHIILPKLIYSLGILNVGLSNAKVICKDFDDDLDRIRRATTDELIETEGIGQVIAASIVDYFEDEDNAGALDNLLAEIDIVKSAKESISSSISGKTFVITGSVNHFANRNEVKDVIEQHGGKVTGSVTAKTDYLINNDIASSSSKNKKAKELGIPIITEEEFMELISIG